MSTSAKANDKTAGVAFHQRLKQQPWGRDFVVRDPEGNLIGFSD